MELSGSLLSSFSFPFFFFLLSLFLFMLSGRGAAHACEFMVHADDLPLVAVRIRPRVIHGRNYRPITQVILRAAIQFNFSIYDSHRRRERRLYVHEIHPIRIMYFILITNIENILKNIYLSSIDKF